MIKLALKHPRLKYANKLVSTTIASHRPTKRTQSTFNHVKKLQTVVLLANKIMRPLQTAVQCVHDDSASLLFDMTLSCAPSGPLQ